MVLQKIRTFFCKLKAAVIHRQSSYLLLHAKSHISVGQKLHCWSTDDLEQSVQWSRADGCTCGHTQEALETIIETTALRHPPSQRHEWQISWWHEQTEPTTNILKSHVRPCQTLITSNGLIDKQYYCLADDMNCLSIIQCPEYDTMGIWVCQAAPAAQKQQGCTLLMWIMCWSLPATAAALEVHCPAF